MCILLNLYINTQPQIVVNLIKPHLMLNQIPQYQDSNHKLIFDICIALINNLIAVLKSIINPITLQSLIL